MLSTHFRKKINTVLPPKTRWTLLATYMWSLPAADSQCSRRVWAWAIITTTAAAAAAICAVVWAVVAAPWAAATTVSSPGTTTTLITIGTTDVPTGGVVCPTMGAAHNVRV